MNKLKNPKIRLFLFLIIFAFFILLGIFYLIKNYKNNYLFKEIGRFYCIGKCTNLFKANENKCKRMNSKNEYEYCLEDNTTFYLDCLPKCSNNEGIVKKLKDNTPTPSLSPIINSPTPSMAPIQKYINVYGYELTESQFQQFIQNYTELVRSYPYISDYDTSTESSTLKQLCDRDNCLPALTALSFITNSGTVCDVINTSCLATENITDCSNNPEISSGNAPESNGAWCCRTRKTNRPYFISCYDPATASSDKKTALKVLNNGGINCAKPNCPDPLKSQTGIIESIITGKITLNYKIPEFSNVQDDISVLISEKNENEANYFSAMNCEKEEDNCVWLISENTKKRVYGYKITYEGGINPYLISIGEKYKVYVSIRHFNDTGNIATTESNKASVQIPASGIKIQDFDLIVRPL
jgi:hypothetical protein